MNLKQMILGLFQMIKNFFFPKLEINDEILKMPSDFKKLSLKNMAYSNFSGMVISLLAFGLSKANYYMEQGYVILAIICFLLFQSTNIIETFFANYNNNLYEQFRMSRQNEISIIASNIIEKVGGRIYTQKGNYKLLLSNEELADSLKTFISADWEIRLEYWWNIVQFLFTTFLFFQAIKNNNLIPNTIFIPIIVMSGIAILFSELFSLSANSKHWDEDKKRRNEFEILSNDVLRISSIVPEDTKIRIRRLQETSQKRLDNNISLNKERMNIRLGNTVFKTILKYFIILWYILSTKALNLGTFASLVAMFAIYDEIIHKISLISIQMQETSKVLMNYNKEKENIKLFLDEYKKRTSPDISGQTLNNIDDEAQPLYISDFKIKYMEKSENDKPFSLVFNGSLRFDAGDIVLLSGASGSGKSTFMKMISKKIVLSSDSSSSNSTDKYIFFDETLSFGSRSLYEELFCLLDNDSPVTDSDLNKMKYLLDNLHLWAEIKNMGKDVLKWLKENYYNSLSNGQKQRIIITKLLFWLNYDVDVVCLDECTSGLDEISSEGADANKVLQFIFEYCNKDKKRIIFFASHQNLGNLANKELFFRKAVDNTNTITVKK